MSGSQFYPPTVIIPETNIPTSLVSAEEQGEILYDNPREFTESSRENALLRLGRLRQSSDREARVDELLRSSAAGVTKKERRRKKRRENIEMGFKTTAAGAVAGGFGGTVMKGAIAHKGPLVVGVGVPTGKAMMAAGVGIAAAGVVGTVALGVYYGLGLDVPLEESPEYSESEFLGPYLHLGEEKKVSDSLVKE